MFSSSSSSTDNLGRNSYKNMLYAHAIQRETLKQVRMKAIHELADIREE